jgi:hypothetical protein
MVFSKRGTGSRPQLGQVLAVCDAGKCAHVLDTEMNMVSQS